jgi:hypothetical protein
MMLWMVVIADSNYLIAVTEQLLLTLQYLLMMKVIVVTSEQNLHTLYCQ